MFNFDMLGKGFAFPFAFDDGTGGVAKSEGPALVEADLAFILGTSVGERFMNPTFGSRINNALFMLDTGVQRDLLRSYIVDALALDPRVSEVGEVTVESDPDMEHGLLVGVSFRLLTESDERNLVIPLIRGY